MKKQIVTAFATLIIMSSLSGCGNMSLGLGTFEFNKIHVDTHQYSGCFDVIKWYESGNGIEVMTKEAGAMWFSEGTYILLSGDYGCPYCGAKMDGD